MRIATYNVNGVNGRLAVLLRWLEQTEPDIVCLQELKAPQGSFPARALEKAGYGSLWLGQKQWNGVAILARDATPHKSRHGLPDMEEDTQSRYLEAAVSGILVGCLYAPNGNPLGSVKFDYKLAWLKCFSAHCAKLLKAKVPVVLAGDYNVIPTELDVYNPSRWLDDALFAPEARAAYEKIVAKGWTDALRSLYPDEKIYTFWKYLRNAYARDAGLRIDHFLLSPVLAKRLVTAGVDRDVRGWPKTSDHAPVWIELGALKPERRRPKASRSKKRS